MYKSKAVEFLKTLTKDELKRFGDFVSSPYYNKNGNVIKLFEELKNYYPDFMAPGVSKEKLYRKIFGGKGYNEQVMKNLSSQILGLSKEFLSTEHYSTNYREKTMNLLRGLSLRKLDTLFNSEMKTLQKELLDIKNLSDPMFFYLYRMELENINFMLSRDKQQKVPDSVLRQGEYLIFFFLVQLSVAFNNIKINEDSFNAKFDVNLVEEFIKNTDLEKLMNYIKDNDIKFGSIVDMHYNKMMCALEPEKEEYYFKLKELFISYVPNLHRLEMYNVFTTLESYCVFKLNADNRKFFRELFEVYNLAIIHNLILAENTSQITAMKFRNIYTCAMRMGEVEWAKNFVDNYKGYLSDESRSLADLAYSQLYFAEKNYDAAMEKLLEINSDLHFVKLDIRTIMIRVYYEQNYIESAISALNSFRQFLNNNDHIVTSTKQKCVNFINVVTNLLKQKPNPDKKKLAELKKKTENELITSRGWVLEKIEELTKQKKPAKSA